MNERPHIHQINIYDRGAYWHVDYGDQPVEVPNKPIRRNNESDIEWENRCVIELKSVINKIIQEHDKQSILAGQGLTIIQRAMPQLCDVKVWGTEQIENPQPFYITESPKPPKSFIRRIFKL